MSRRRPPVVARSRLTGRRFGVIGLVLLSMAVCLSGCASSTPSLSSLTPTTGDVPSGASPQPGPRSPSLGPPRLQTITPTPTRRPLAAATPSAMVRIVADDYFFHPQEVVVKVGTPIEWVGEGTFVHTIDGKQSLLQWGGTVGTKGGHTFQMTFTEPGIYRYECRVHPGDMVARVVVVP